MATSFKAQEPGIQPAPKLPPSKPLQIFLLVALLISGAAYVSDEYTRLFAPHHVSPNALQREVESRGEYASHMEAGLRAARSQQYEQALTQFQLAGKAKNAAEASYNAALILLKLARPDEAMTQFKEAVKLNPHYTEVFLAWGHALMAEGKPDEAGHVFHQALQVSPNSGQAHFDLALALMEQKRIAQADLRAAQADGRSADAVTLTAKADRLQSDALQQINIAQRLGLDRPELWLSYGQLLSEQQKFADAETYLRRAVLAKPDLADGHFALAAAEERLNKYAEAIGQYEATLALRADDPPTLERLALIYATATNQDLRSPKLAIQLGIRANDAAASQNPRFMDTLARCYAAAGDFLQAINWEDKAIHRAEQIRDLQMLQELKPRYALFIEHKIE